MGSGGSFITDASAVSPGRQIGLDVQNASPPTAAYMGVDDTLWLMASSSVNNVILTVTYRLLMPDGSIIPNQQQVNVGGGRSPGWYPFTLPECFILGLSITANISASFPEVYVTAMISRGNPVVGVISQVLCQGYCYQIAGVSWPNGVNTIAFGVPGNIRSITGTMPAAGQNISESVPSNARWRLIAIRITLITSAVGTGRVMALTFDDGVNVFCSDTTPLIQPVSTVWVYNFADGFAGVVNTGSPVMAQIPQHLPLNQTWRIRTNIVNLDAADQLSAPQYVVEEWLAV